MTPTQEWFSGFPQVARQLLGFAPVLLSAALLTLVGWLLARLARFLASRAVTAVLTRLGGRPSLRGAIVSSGVATQVPAVIGGFAYWLVLLFFVAAALETLGLPVVTGALNRVAYYLPNVLAALVVIFAGIIVGSLVRGLVNRTAASAGVDFGTAVGSLAQWTVILVAVVVALEQVGIEAQVLIVIVAIVARHHARGRRAGLRAGRAHRGEQHHRVVLRRPGVPDRPTGADRRDRGQDRPDHPDRGLPGHAAGTGSGARQAVQRRGLRARDRALAVQPDERLALDFMEAHPDDAARLLERATPDEAAALLDEVPVPMVAGILRLMAPASAAGCAAAMPVERLAEIVGELPLDAAVSVMHRLEPSRRDAVLARLPVTMEVPLRRLLAFGAHTAGALADPLALALPEDLTVAQAVEQLRGRGGHLLYYLYVVARDQTLVGVLDMPELMSARPEDTLAAAMRRDPIRLEADTGFVDPRRSPRLAEPGRAPRGGRPGTPGRRDPPHGGAAAGGGAGPPGQERVGARDAGRPVGALLGRARRHVPSRRRGRAALSILSRKNRELTDAH